MNELAIKSEFSISASTDAAIKKLSKESAKRATALALDIGDFSKTVATADKVVTDKALPLSKSIAIQLSVIAETEKFGKKENFRGIGDFAEQAFGMKSVFTSNHVGVGKYFYRANNPTAATAVEWYGTVSMLSKFLPLRKLSKQAFPYSLIEDAFKAGDLTADSTQRDIEDWVKSKLPEVEKPEVMFDCVAMPSGERVNNVTWSNYAVRFGDDTKVRKVALDDGEKLVDDDGTPWEVVTILKPDYSAAAVVWRHKHHEPKGVSAPESTKESPLDRARRLLAALSPEEIAELLESGKA